MVIPEVNPGVRPLIYGSVLGAVPLVFALLGRLSATLRLDRYAEQYREFAPESGGFDRTPAVVEADGACPRCGERNDPEFTFCRSCQARIGA